LVLSSESKANKRRVYKTQPSVLLSLVSQTKHSINIEIIMDAEGEIHEEIRQLVNLNLSDSSLNMSDTYSESSHTSNHDIWGERIKVDDEYCSSSSSNSSRTDPKKIDRTISRVQSGRSNNSNNNEKLNAFKKKYSNTVGALENEIVMRQLQKL